jgi:hypothetical protein
MSAERPIADLLGSGRGLRKTAGDLEEAFRQGLLYEIVVQGAKRVRERAEEVPPGERHGHDADRGRGRKWGHGRGTRDRRFDPRVDGNLG